MMQPEVNDELAQRRWKPPPWYRWERFNLIPTWYYRPENDWNRSDWGFHWLGLSVWTGIGFQVNVEIEMNDQDAFLQIQVPWLHVRLTVPLFPQNWHQKLWRTKRGPEEPTDDSGELPFS